MKRNAGYTFIEMLIAMTILIVGIVAIMRMLPLALREAHLAGEKSVAAQFADAQVGLTRSIGAEKVQLDYLQTARQSVENVLTAEQIYESHAMYTGWQTDFHRMPGAAETYLQRVVFSVEMPDGRRETFVTYVARQ